MRVRFNSIAAAGGRPPLQTPATPVRCAHSGIRLTLLTFPFRSHSPASRIMALIPPAWPPASGDWRRIRFVIDVTESDTDGVLRELFQKHVSVQSYHGLNDVGCDRVIDDAPNHPTIVITDDSCRPIDARALDSGASSSLHSISVSAPARSTASNKQVRWHRNTDLNSLVFAQVICCSSYNGGHVVRDNSSTIRSSCPSSSSPSSRNG
jgi:hypothetical protein